MPEVETREHHRPSALYKKPLVWLVAGICSVFIFFLNSIYGFLALNNPIGGGALIVEGWVPEKTLAKSIEVFNSGKYQYFVLVGGPIEEARGHPGQPATYAELAARRLEKLGFDTAKISKVNVAPVSTNRTFTGAITVKRWLEDSKIKVCCVDIFTVGVHARKSWMLSRYAFGSAYRVGIIAGPEGNFDPKYWFASRRGLAIIGRNVLGYLYYKCWIFYHSALEPGVVRSSLLPNRRSSAFWIA